MVDDADIAFALQSARVAQQVARIDASLPAGVEGECDECGEWMGRLVGGRCGFCRDGRRPPPEAYEHAAQRRLASTLTDQTQPISSPAAKEPVMTAKVTPETRVISMPVTGEVLRAIETRAAERDLPLGQAARSWIEETLHAEPTPAPAEVALENLPDTVLVAELGRRLNHGASQSDFDAEVARADAAEAKLASLRGLLID